MTSCYDPAPPPSNYHHWRDNVANSELRNGDVVILDYECEFGEEVTMSLISDDNDEDRVLCSETYMKGFRASRAISATSLVTSAFE